MFSKQEILKNLREWRDAQAKKEGVEIFRVLSNQTISDIVFAAPKNKNELLSIKGIKDRKYAKYGLEILDIVNSRASSNSIPQVINSISTDLSPKEKILSVSDFLELLNIGLHASAAKVHGEVSSVSTKNGHCYFALKDKDGSVLNAIIWQSNYKMSGLVMEIGMELTASGYPDIYKPTGRLSFMAETLELVGEGALKKAYDALYKKLEKEGLFRAETKKQLPEYPHRIGLITSREGAVIYDFMNNIGRYGYHISFMDSRVEGVQAVRDLLTAVQEFKKRNDIDVLVMIRGGGSLESLQAFNNESLVREIASCKFPTIVGIGHDKDVPLVSLTSDHACSTPTAVAKMLNTGWEHALAKTQIAEGKIFGRFSTLLHEHAALLNRLSSSLEDNLTAIIKKMHGIAERFNQNLLYLRQNIIFIGDKLPKIQIQLSQSFEYALKNVYERIIYSEKMLAANNPEHQLKLGWSIAFSSEGKVVRRVQDVSAGDPLLVKVSDGMIQARTE